MRTTSAAIALAALGLFAPMLPFAPFGGGGAAAQGAQQSPFAGEEWYDQIATVKVNREDARAFFVPYQDAGTALANEASAFSRDFSKSSYYMPLSGAWKFRAVSRPADRIVGFWERGFDDGGWDDIPVPSSWQAIRKADGAPKYDPPIYRNSLYPWDNFGGEPVSTVNPVKAPTIFNPVGHYRRSFALPQGWNGRRVFVSFQGVESAFYLWVNGQKVGYAEDSYTASEFDITKHVQRGENTIAVQVYRWSTGSYLENQDFIRMSGIFRDVFLYSKAEVELRDFFIAPGLDAGYASGSLNVEATVRNFGRASGGYTVEATLKNMDDSDVWARPLSIPVRVEAAGAAPSVKVASGSQAVASPRLWFAETPELYKVLLQLKDPRGRVVETAVARTGFRKLEIADAPVATGHQVLLINGKPIMIRGTNRHETSLENGRAVTKGEIMQDLLNMKRMNINAIRTSHYPNNVITYGLADELGLYVFDESNVETHTAAQSRNPADRIPGTNPLWINSVVDRTASVVERDKNHPSVIVWSLGNESTYIEWPRAPYTDYAFYHSSQYARKRDNTRMVYYDRDNRKDIADLRSQMYPGYVGARRHALQTEPPENSHIAKADLMMPHIICEYSHSMGNAGGGFNEYWKVFREVPQAQGGFIWDYIDQSLWLPVPKGAANPGDGRFFAYGGDWGDAHNDAAFCANGMMFADRTPKPFVNEIRHVYQEVWYTATEGGLKDGQINISNEFLNKNLKDFAHRWRIRKDGEIVAVGALSLDVPPLSKADVAIPAARAIEPEPGAEYFLELEASLKADTAWGKAGHVIAEAQFGLPAGAGESSPDRGANLGALPPFASVADGPDRLEVSGAGFSIAFDKAAAELSSIKKNGKELLVRGPRINHWRHPGDNDTFRGRGQFNATFIDSWKNATKGAVSVAKDPGGKYVTITAPSTLANGASNTTIYTIYSSGEIAVENTLSSALEDCMLRIGMKLEMPKGYDNVTYYGRGPGENYSDRAVGSPVGVYRAKAEDMFEQYIRPQFFGNRTGVRWMAVTDSRGDGLMVAAKGTIEACASHYDDSEFEVGAPDAQGQDDRRRAQPHISRGAARHIYQVPKHEGAVFNIDMMQAPIGCWGGFSGERPPVEMQTPANGTYTYSYRIVPVTGATAAVMMKESKRPFELQKN